MFTRWKHCFPVRFGGKSAPRRRSETCPNQTRTPCALGLIARPKVVSALCVDKEVPQAFSLREIYLYWSWSIPSLQTHSRLNSGLVCLFKQKLLVGSGQTHSPVMISRLASSRWLEIKSPIVTQSGRYPVASGSEKSERTAATFGFFFLSFLVLPPAMKPKARRSRWKPDRGEETRGWGGVEWLRSNQGSVSSWWSVELGHTLSSDWWAFIKALPVFRPALMAKVEL